MLRKIYFSIVTLLLVGASAVAQNNGGAIKVLLKDKSNGETIPFANVVAYQGGVQVGVGTTDMDGYAMIKPLSPGKYDVKGVYVGYQAEEIKGVVVGESKTAYITIQLNNGEGVKLDEVVVVEYQEPLIDGDMKSGGTVTREEYQNMATKNINSVAATTAGVYQADEGKGLNVRGGRSNSTTYFVDGVKVIGGLGVPQQGVEQLNVITGGVPAQYGDATSGIISVTTRGPQSKFFGGVELISSQLTDAYGYNSLGFSVGGPIFQKKDSAGNKTPLVGFILSGQGTYEKDPTPSYTPVWQLNTDKLKEIQSNPLHLVPSNAAGVEDTYRSELLYVTKNDMYTTKVRPNVANRSIQLTGKLDFKITPNTNLTLGGAFDYGNSRGYDLGGSYQSRYAMYNAENNPQRIDNTWRVFANLRQKFGTNQTSSEKEKTQSVITNAYFTFLASYERSKSTVQDESHKDKIFNYGYQGKYNFNYKYDDYIGNYAFKDRVYDPNSNSLINRYYYQGTSQTDVTYERSELNPLTANYSTQVFNHFGTLPTVNAAIGKQALVNGDAPDDIYDLYRASGLQYAVYGKNETSQLRFTSSFSADIKNHALMVGVEYDQRDNRGYSINATGLWTRMRQLSNAYLGAPDTSYVLNPQFSTATDQYYTSKLVVNNQSQFMETLHEKLGLDGQTKINTDGLSPDDLSLDMFSAADLVNGGIGSYVTYYGYDHTGKRDNAATSIDKFLNNKNSRGYNTFNIGSYRPIYVSGFIQDKFDFKDIKFNVGVRVDRFDANQKVLKDPYLFHEAYTAGEKAPDRPENIKENYIPYVASLGSETIVGYRNGDTWYNSEGKEISDPNGLTTAGRVFPWLKDPTFAQSNGFSANAFTDYKPQINVMPRVAFSFPISDVANFFAHYDVLTQRPSGIDMRFDPSDYYYINGQSSNPFITNSNLKPERTMDYEIGYNQVLNEKKNAALKITAFYRELRNQITTQTLNQAYPRTYYTYVNRDFGTVKGLSLEFDLRRTGGVSLNANYTLQFADGSGSNSGSGANLSSSGQPNLRVTLPLDYDQRHNFVLTLDYRFSEGKDYKGPQWNKKKKDGSSQTIQILQNVGANISFLTGSGTPYTRYGSPTVFGGRSSIFGSLNGSNKPWQFRSNLRVDKNIELTWGKKEGEDRKTANLNIYLQVLNLFNTKNVLTVYNYSGNAEDDAYLPSAQGLQTAANAANSYGTAQPYQDQYAIFTQYRSSNYGRPRTIRIGVTLEF